LYREEYAKAGFVMLPAVDESGRRTGWQATGHALGLLALGMLPFVFGLTGMIYLAGSLIAGVAFVTCAIRFQLRLTTSSARVLFLASIIYLPLVLLLLVLDKA
jgi:protoheme IX farnesyltransferase